jgi:hypothetical protein
MSALTEAPVFSERAFSFCILGEYSRETLTPIDSNWNLAEAATSSFAVSWESKVWVRLPHASAKVSLIQLLL